MKRPKYLHRWCILITACYMGMIFLLSSLEIRSDSPISWAEELLRRIPYIDKIVHSGIYTGLGFFLLLALGRRRWLLAGFIGLVFAASDEFHQAFVPTRSPDVIDWLADALGLGLGMLLAAWWEREFRRRRSRVAHAGSPESSWRW
ncbi:VanZ like family protein [Planctomycetes bacterium Pan216]|uniref:VanZ like family protein n=1 Tax=Kolteria novifilia TaxID=2527975 RepID=A0A518B3T0_9BACT|nr:VanZ like family protein [Planctomycetes bacterium Pan216]